MKLGKRGRSPKEDVETEMKERILAHAEQKTEKKKATGKVKGKTEGNGNMKAKKGK